MNELPKCNFDGHPMRPDADPAVKLSQSLQLCRGKQRNAYNTSVYQGQAHPESKGSKWLKESINLFRGFCTLLLSSSYFVGAEINMTASSGCIWKTWLKCECMSKSHFSFFKTNKFYKSVLIIKQFLSKLCFKKWKTNRTMFSWGFLWENLHLGLRFKD